MDYIITSVSFNPVLYTHKFYHTKEDNIIEIDGDKLSIYSIDGTWEAKVNYAVLGNMVCDCRMLDFLNMDFVNGKNKAIVQTLDNKYKAHSRLPPKCSVFIALTNSEHCDAVLISITSRYITVKCNHKMSGRTNFMVDRRTIVMTRGGLKNTYKKVIADSPAMGRGRLRDMLMYPELWQTILECDVPTSYYSEIFTK